MNGLNAHLPELSNWLVADLWQHLVLVPVILTTGWHTSHWTNEKISGHLASKIALSKAMVLQQRLLCHRKRPWRRTGVRIGTRPRQRTLHQHRPPALPWHIWVWDRSNPEACQMPPGTAPLISPPLTRSASKWTSPSGHVYQPVPRKGGRAEPGLWPAAPSHQPHLPGIKIVSHKTHRLVRQFLSLEARWASGHH